ncbi:hypothetical protein M501DRAFT_1003640 [Patellaria atrata CBS 101060]|uniref:Dienelactone hydrolase domain-containing protein n=1 Tax=Patellaria atrata CBS 101060 TaxID=1346257 RepID=A0A9P4SAG7_9PEZI|nr:hypothetical protein M501DRAFT_1003640 [Patellaria atrata CBS 101060]
MSCPDCFKGAIHDHATPKGEESTIHGIRTYIASPPVSSGSNSTIIYISDVFGLRLVNNKLLADELAAGTGHRVLVPDCVPGGGMDINAMNYVDTFTTPPVWYDVIGQFKRIMALLRAAMLFIPFMINAAPPIAYPNVLSYSRAVKADLPQGAKLGVCGFCWGGYLSTQLCTEPSVENGNERLIDAQFCGHPSFLKTPGMIVDAISKFKTPYSVAIGDKDFVFPLREIQKTEAALREKVGRGEGDGGYNYEIKTYKGCRHGFVVRSRPGDKNESERAEEAKEQAIHWFQAFMRS